MAGLVGIVQRQGDPPTARLLERMMDACVHGGPDKAHFIDGPTALGWTGHAAEDAPPQPYEHDNLVVLLDGWIIVEDQLDAGSATPRTNDPAHLVQAWNRWGLDLVEHLDGDFAAAIFERTSGVLHLIRDRNGLRNLYWTRSRGSLAFATDLPALLELPWVSRQLHRERLAEYLSFCTVHEPRTLLRDVCQLEPGQRLRFADDVVRLHHYHQPIYAAPDTPIPREADVLPELQRVVERAVRRRLSSHERIGVYLSGGVGSAAIVAATRAASRTVNTYTVSVQDEDHPESPFGGRVSRILGMNHHSVVVTTKDIATHFDPAVNSLGHPIGHPSVVILWMLARAARHDVDVVLTGDGAEEMFGGRTMAGALEGLRRSRRFAKLPFLARETAKRVLRKTSVQAPWTSPPEVYGLVQGIGGVRLTPTKQRRALLLDEELVRPEVRVEVLKAFYDEVETDAINAVLHAYYRSSLISTDIPKLDRTTTAFGIEARVPFLDRELMRFARRLPGGYKARHPRGGLPSRWLLRAALADSIPTALINRPDRSMTSPLGPWLTGPGRLFLEERFDLLREDPLDLWHTNALEGLRRGLSRRGTSAHQLWALFILDAWIRGIRAN